MRFTDNDFLSPNFEQTASLPLVQRPADSEKCSAAHLSYILTGKGYINQNSVLHLFPGFRRQFKQDTGDTLLHTPGYKRLLAFL